MASPHKMTVYFKGRDFNELSYLPDVAYTINHYSFNVIGGPEEAGITAVGSNEEIWKFAEMLRCPVTIYDANNDAVWWGLVYEVTLNVGNISFGVSLENMANNVFVAYTQHGDRMTTSTVSDSRSESEYGKKELLITYGDAITSEAEERRDTALNTLKYPISFIEPHPQSPGRKSANIRCAGWYKTLEWQYYSQAKGLVSYTGTGQGQQNVGVILNSACIVFDGGSKTIKDWSEGLSTFEKGDYIDIQGTTHNDGVYTVVSSGTSGCSLTVAEALTSETNATTTIVTASKVVQKFKQHSGSSWDASYVQVRARTIGAPTDDLTVAILSSGCTIEASGSIAASDLDSTMQWREFQLDTNATLATATEYWVLLGRSGTPSAASDAYEIDVDESLGYSDGPFHLYLNDTWYTRSTDCDMLFKVLGTQPITSQITEMVQNSEFLIGVSVENTSTIETNQYRDGETTMKVEIEELLKVGDGNGKRLLAEVTENRRLRIYVEPTQGDDDYTWYANGDIRDAQHNFVPKYKCVVGKWAKIRELIPTTFDQSLIANPSCFFIERANYYAQTDVYSPQSKNTSSIWSIGETTEG